MRRLLPVLLVLAWTGPAFATSGDAGTVAADFLRLNAGAAAAAQGEAYAGRSGGIEVFPYNPAGTAYATRHEVLLQHNQYLLDITADYAGLLWRGDRLKVAGAFQHIDEGTLTRRTISNPLGSGTYDAGAQVAMLGFAFPLTGRFAFGASGKYFREVLDREVRQGWAGDAGLLLRLDRQRDWTVGLVARNLGPTVQFDLDEEELPQEYAVGTSFYIWPQYVRLSGEAVKPRHQEIDYRAGLEVRPLRQLALRGGYQSSNDLGTGFSGGAGFEFPYLSVDYAYVDYDEAGSSHRFALTMGWGEVAESVPVAVPALPAPLPETRAVAAQPETRVVTPPVAAPEPAPPITVAMPPEVERLLREGEAFTRAGQFWHAAERYRAVLALDPHNYLAYYQLGHAAYQVAQYDAADTAFMCALVLNPNSVEAMVNLGAAAFQLGEYETAALLWEKALLLDPHCDVARRNREELRRMGY